MNTPTPLQILQAHSLPSVVQGEIEQLILGGVLRPGQRINEASLAERFGTSRGPLREALRPLCSRMAGGSAGVSWGRLSAISPTTCEGRMSPAPIPVKRKLI